jgi:hypothetical protein
LRRPEVGPCRRLSPWLSGAGGEPELQVRDDGIMISQRFRPASRTRHEGSNSLVTAGLAP